MFCRWSSPSTAAGDTVWSAIAVSGFLAGAAEYRVSVHIKGKGCGGKGKEEEDMPSHTEEQSLCGCCCAGKGWIHKNVDGYPLIDAQIITHAHGSLKWLILFQELQLLAAFCTLTQLTKYSKSWIFCFY